MLENRWWWLRHAKVFNPDLLIIGQGEAEIIPPSAEEIGTIRQKLPLSLKVVASDLSRTRATLACLGLKPTSLLIDPALREQNFGQWEGQKWAEVAPANNPFWHDPIRSIPPGGESFAQLLERVGKAIFRIDRAIGKGYDMLSVGHAGSIRAALVVAGMLPLDQALGIEIPHLSLTRIP